VNVLRLDLDIDTRDNVIPDRHSRVWNPATMPDDTMLDSRSLAALDSGMTVFTPYPRPALNTVIPDRHSRVWNPAPLNHD